MLKEKQVKQKSQPKLFSDDLNKEIKNSDRLFKIAVKTQKVEDWSMFKVMKLIGQVKKSYLKQQSQ